MNDQNILYKIEAILIKYLIPTDQEMVTINKVAREILKIFKEK